MKLISRITSIFGRGHHLSTASLAASGAAELPSAVSKGTKPITKTYPNSAHIATPSFMI